MISKIQQMLTVALEKTNKLEIKGMPRIMVYLFLFLLIISVVLFIGAWVWAWIYTGHAEFALMISFIGQITSAPLVGALMFFGKALSNPDNDHDGVNDAFEDERKDKQCTPPIRPIPK
jgi:hypothetical protein